MIMHRFYFFCATIFFAFPIIGMEKEISEPALDVPSLVYLFFCAATDVSQLKRDEIFDSKQFATMKACRNKLKGHHHNNTQEADEELFGAGDHLSDDEKYYTRCSTPEDTLMRCERLNGQIERNDIKIHNNDQQLARLKKGFEKESTILDITDAHQQNLKVLQGKIADAEYDQAMLKKTHLILTNYRKQEQTHIHEKQKQLEDLIKENNAAILRANNLDYQALSESIAPGASNTPEQKIEILIEECIVWQKQVDAITKVLQKIDGHEPKEQERKKTFWGRLFGW